MNYKYRITTTEEFKRFVSSSNHFVCPYVPRIIFKHKVLYFKGKIIIYINKEDNIIHIRKLILLPSKYKRYYIGFKTLRKINNYSLIESFINFHYDEMTSILNLLYPLLKEYYEK